MKTATVLLIMAMVGLVSVPASSGTSPDRSTAVEDMDCSVSIKGKYAGVEMDLEITIYDISLFECGLLKLGVRSALAIE